MVNILPTQKGIFFDGSFPRVSTRLERFESGEALTDQLIVYVFTRYLRLVRLAMGMVGGKAWIFTLDGMLVAFFSLMKIGSDSFGRPRHHHQHQYY